MTIHRRVLVGIALVALGMAPSAARAQGLSNSGYSAQEQSRLERYVGDANDLRTMAIDGLGAKRAYHKAAVKADWGLRDIGYEQSIRNPGAIDDAYRSMSPSGAVGRQADLQNALKADRWQQSLDPKWLKYGSMGHSVYDKGVEIQRAFSENGPYSEKAWSSIVSASVDIAVEQTADKVPGGGTALILYEEAFGDSPGGHVAQATEYLSRKVGENVVDPLTDWMAEQRQNAAEAKVLEDIAARARSAPPRDPRPEATTPSPSTAPGPRAPADPRPTVRGPAGAAPAAPASPPSGKSDDSGQTLVGLLGIANAVLEGINAGRSWAPARSSPAPAAGNVSANNFTPGTFGAQRPASTPSAKQLAPPRQRTRAEICQPLYADNIQCNWHHCMGLKCQRK